MTAEAQRLLERMIDEVFNEADAATRTRVIAEIFAENAEFVDSDRTVTGHEALADRISELLAQGPDLVFTPAGSFRGVGSLGMRAWRLGPPQGDSVLGGLDVVDVVGGRISRLWTILD